MTRPGNFSSPSKAGTLGVEKWPVATTTKSKVSDSILSSTRSLTVTVKSRLSTSNATCRTAWQNFMYLRTSLRSTRPAI